MNFQVQLAAQLAQSNETLLNAKLGALLLAALHYEEQSSGGEHPLMAGAHLRLAAKAWAQAYKSAP